ncbi:MAG: hypothetical protein HC913_18930 [Microscillaceae bacterium]|nr:hypothetical protein [Microscillaceae bacterium]
MAAPSRVLILALGLLSSGLRAQNFSTAPRDVAWAVAIRSPDGHWGVALASTLPRCERFALAMQAEKGLLLQLSEASTDSLFRLWVQWPKEGPAFIEKGIGWRHQAGLTELAFGNHWAYVVKNLPQQQFLDTLVKNLSFPSPFRIGTQLCQVLQSVAQFVTPLSARMLLYREGSEVPTWEGKVDFGPEPILVLRDWYVYDQLQKQVQNARNLNPDEWEALCQDLRAFPGLYPAGLEAALLRGEKSIALDFLRLALQEEKAPPLSVLDYFVLNGEAAYQDLLPASMTESDWRAALRSLLHWQKPDEMLFWWKKPSRKRPIRPIFIGWPVKPIARKIARPWLKNITAAPCN